MRQLILLLMSITFSSLSAQDDQDWPVKPETYNVFDSSRVESVYTYMERDQKETVFRDRILLVGLSQSVYEDYGTYRVDSCLRSNSKKQWMHSDLMKLYKEYDANDYLFYIHKSSNPKFLKVYDALVIDYYLYADSVSFNWKIGREKMEICGYTCRKATCVFRGRKWTAWFTSKIDVSDGPWKFRGLPGLILRAEDESEDHVFYAISIRKGGSPMYVGNSKYMPISRTKFNRAVKAYRDNPSIFWGDSYLLPKNAKGNKLTVAKSLPYNPLELE